MVRVDLGRASRCKYTLWQTCHIDAMPRQKHGVAEHGLTPYKDTSPPFSNVPRLAGQIEREPSCAGHSTRSCVILVASFRGQRSKAVRGPSMLLPFCVGVWTTLVTLVRLLSRMHSNASGTHAPVYGDKLR